MIKYQLKSDVSKPKVMSVTELTRGLKLLLESQFAGVWVEGEISNFKWHTSGHMYFSMKDELAQISCVMFRRENAAIGFEPKDGMQVLCRARVSVYEPRGQYQLYVERIEPQGVGALQLRFEAMKEKLRKEGLFDEARKRPMPFLPRKIAVVTSVDGAALRDILHILERRFSGVHILIYPVAVQGITAAPGIAEAIDHLSRENTADVLIVARGGGSLEDLWAFNEEVVARAIYNSDIPVISAVGHETDFTIADFVADLRAPTPSAAAEIVLPLFEEILSRTRELERRSLNALRALIDDSRERLENLTERRSLKDPLAVFEALFQRVDETKKDLMGAIKNFMTRRREEAGLLIHKLDALGPLNTLKRGFSVTLRHPQGTVVRVQSLKVGVEVKTVLKDGFFLSRVTEVDDGR